MQELNYLFNFQFSNQDHHFFGIPKKYYLTSLFLSTKHDSIVQDVPLFFTPIYLMVDVKFNVTIKKIAQHTFFYNNELLQSNLVNWKLPNFTNHQNPITYQQAVLQLMADNYLTKHDYCLENHDFIIHPKFHIGHLKYQFHLSQTTPFPLIPVNKYKVKTQQQAIVNTFKLPVEQKLFDFQSHKKIAYQAIR